MKNNIRPLLMVASLMAAAAGCWVAADRLGLGEYVSTRFIAKKEQKSEQKGEAMKVISHEASAGLQEPSHHDFSAKATDAGDRLVCYADELFAPWVDPTSPGRQYLWENVDLSTFGQRNPEKLITWMSQACTSYPSIYEHLERLLTPPAQRKQRTGGLSDTEEQRAWLSKFYTMLDHNPQDFVDTLLQSPLAREKQNDLDLLEEARPLSDHYTAWGKLLFYDSDKELRLHYHFCWANRLFFYFFDDGFKRMRALMDNPANHPVLRVLYANMWWPLVGNGWKAFNLDSLGAVVHEAKRGKTVMYLAGGCDIYQLLMAGAYNLHVVDPILPTQSKFCVDIAVMDLLVGGDPQLFSIGDVIRFPQGITLTRSSFKQAGEPFQASCADGQDRMIQPSITVWTVTDDQGNKLGSVTYDRRYCRQSDFRVDKNHVLYMSFNEMYYSCASTKPWGIDAHKFDDGIIIHVKQLSKPVNKRIMCNMYEADAAPFKFIKLGSESN